MAFFTLHTTKEPSWFIMMPALKRHHHPSIMSSTIIMKGFQWILPLNQGMLERAFRIFFKKTFSLESSVQRRHFIALTLRMSNGSGVIYNEKCLYMGDWINPLWLKVLGFRYRHGCRLFFRFHQSKSSFCILRFAKKCIPIRQKVVVWSPNRNNPVQVNATFQLSQDGDLILKDSGGRMVWSSQTEGNSVTGMNLKEDGNLVLFGQNNEPVWQSFDYPADSLLVGQKFESGQKLTASVSDSNWSEGDINETIRNFNNGTISSSVAQFMKLEPDGHLKVFECGENGWTLLVDLIDLKSGACGYPLVCGTYGVCSDGRQCGCLEMSSNHGNYFRELSFGQPNLGCSLVTPISCDDSQYHILLPLSNTYYFAFSLDEQQMSVDECKTLCMRNCSCKATVFGKQAFKGRSSINGSCLLLNEVFSIADNGNGFVSPYNTTLYVKVQQQHPYVKAETPSYVRVSRHKVKILASAFAAVSGVSCVIVSWLICFRRREKEQSEIEDDFLCVPGMPTRYSYENLKATTEGFSKKLGEGGFGSVYEGMLSDGTKVAVKCLDGLAKVRDSFLVEVKAIGGIHHVNLVKLKGFCFEKSHRLLVYEYMANKSLDRWIFHENEENHCLPWHIRKKIISDIAKGLAYLHEECSPKIIHLDIKPENILLDETFNAKISDFGLSKLIEKDQSRVITTMRGTPGYLAPEWLSAAITEKVDVYSFGIVMIDGDKHLLAVFKGKAEEGKLKELVDKRSEIMQENIEEAVEMMKIAAWCLQGDFTKRPSMSLVVKVMEGLIYCPVQDKSESLHLTQFNAHKVGCSFRSSSIDVSAVF
ncbi:OLC1v1023651C1 [Oldenlandia corymbosa var. corymbosa]|uniref:Receptor-like serine/threonine-protein kinase n=1 Tax=Oldenlandia corymbosa var. corymbosa TaxID=529605 RepID=A0AAV1C0L6_OLDCO|nr:OLC1v1023651C1 [Oldenlandia corymbosa var. corymbosa]